MESICKAKFSHYHTSLYCRHTALTDCVMYVMHESTPSYIWSHVHLHLRPTTGCMLLGVPGPIQLSTEIPQGLAATHISH